MLTTLTAKNGTIKPGIPLTKAISKPKGISEIRTIINLALNSDILNSLNPKDK